MSVGTATRYDREFDRWYAYGGCDLGAMCTPIRTVFKLWSPEAVRVELFLYRSDASDACGRLALVPEEQGVWAAHVEGDLHGIYYDYEVETPAGTARTADPYAMACGRNGARSMVVDLSRTDPEGFASDCPPPLPPENIIYELHVKDFSCDPGSGVPEECQGKFKAFAWKSPDGRLPTCMEHLKSLGVTHVQLLPIFDYATVDEGGDAGQFNWGYDPLNYNTPEGSYSTNPSDPATRIREMKEMVQAMHKAGIGVVMDVVYNHTAENDGSNFELTAPGYYHRHWNDGKYSDASACGNETASDLKQMQDYIVNSVKYWAKEYHIDGFRFDLMAIHDTETMNRVARELKEINPNIIIYGEGWTAGDSPLQPERRALKENVSKMEGIAVFSDDIRDAVKGHYSNEADPGFATGKPGNEETVKIGIVAATNHPQVDYSKGNNSRFPYAKSPEMIINYVSCHDDLCLTDKLHKSMPGATEQEMLDAAKLAQTIVFTSQGTPFMFAGEEVFRDKKGVHNSFKSPDSINAIDWTNKTRYRDQFEYYKGLVALRKAHPAFRMTDAKEIARNLKFDKIDSKKQPNLISYSLLNNANGDEWKEIKVIFNGADHAQVVKLPKGKWQVVARDGKIDLDNTLGIVTSPEVQVSPRSALIMHR